MNVRSLAKLSTMWCSSMIKRNRGSKILYYHDVYESENYRALDADIQMGTHISLFKKHIEAIRKEGFEIVPRITEPEGQVSIMFDDGFKGIWECRQYFYDNNIKPTVFLPVAFIGRKDKGILSADEILELQSHGFNFESHSWSHIQLTGFNDKELVHELNDSKTALSELLSKDVTGLCMPLGFFTPHLLEKISEAGYKDIYSCIPGNYFDRPFGTITRNLCQYASPLEVKLILHGGNEMLKSRYAKMHNKSAI